MFLRPEVLQGVFIPFLGTVLGSACVFFLKGQMPRVVQRSLTGFRLLRWEEINQVTEVATQGNSGKMVMVFAQSGNWVLSPVLERYDRLTDQLKAMCKKQRIPCCEDE